MFHIYMARISREEMGILLNWSESVFNYFPSKFISNPILIIFNYFAQKSSRIIPAIFSTFTTRVYLYMEIGLHPRNLNQIWPLVQMRCSHFIAACNEGEIQDYTTYNKI